MCISLCGLRTHYFTSQKPHAPLYLKGHGSAFQLSFTGDEWWIFIKIFFQMKNSFHGGSMDIFKGPVLMSLCNRLVSHHLMRHMWCLAPCDIVTVLSFNPGSSFFLRIIISGAVWYCHCPQLQPRIKLIPAEVLFLELSHCKWSLPNSQRETYRVLCRSCSRSYTFGIHNCDWFQAWVFYYLG